MEPGQAGRNYTRRNGSRGPDHVLRLFVNKASLAFLARPSDSEKREDGDRLRQTRGKELRVPNESAKDHYRSQQQAGRSRREYGQLAVHIAETPRHLAGAQPTVPGVPREERRVRGRHFPEEREQETAAS